MGYGDIMNKIKIKEIILFCTVVFVFLTFELIYLFLGVDFNTITGKDYILITLSKYFVIILFLLIYYKKYLVSKWKDFIKKFKSYFMISFKNWLTGFLIMIVSNSIIVNIVGSVGENEEAVQGLINAIPFIALIMTTFLAPFVEEMIFRKSLQDCFNNKTFYMIMSGFIFGLIHTFGGPLIEYLYIIPYGALGFMFAHTINKTDNIYCTIMMHMLHNGFLTLIAILV